MVIRTVIALLGTAVIVGGIILLPLPGPGWLIIFAGLGILALEFAWAGRLLGFAKRQVLRWERWYRAQGLALRIVLGVALAVFLGALILLTAVISFGWPTVHHWGELVLPSMWDAPAHP